MVLYVVPCDHWSPCENKCSGGNCAIDHFKVGVMTSISPGTCMKSCTSRVHRGRRQPAIPGWKKPNSSRQPNTNKKPSPPSREYTPAPIRLIKDWPFLIRWMAKLRIAADRGLGDILYRSKISKRTREFIEKRLKRSCGCEAGRDRLNRDYPTKHAIVLKERSAGAGDAVALTGAVRDFKAHYGDEFDIHVQVPPGPDFWRNHPDCTYKDNPSARIVNVSGYNSINDRKPRHLMQKYMHSICTSLGLPELPIKTLGGDLHLTDKEKDFTHWSALGVTKPFIVLMAGGNNAWTVKWWDSAHYQAVADAMIAKGVCVVQVGHGKPDNWHPPLKGVVNLIGQTDIRQLAGLISHAKAVVCGVTGAMHIAAAVGTPAVVIGGGGEEVEIYKYPNHIALSTIGELDCCQSGGCWKRRCTVPTGEDRGDSLCKYPVRISTRR